MGYTLDLADQIRLGMVDCDDAPEPFYSRCPKCGRFVSGKAFHCVSHPERLQDHAGGSHYKHISGKWYVPPHYQQLCDCTKCGTVVVMEDEEYNWQTKSAFPKGEISLDYGDEREARTK